MIKFIRLLIRYTCSTKRGVKLLICYIFANTQSQGQVNVSNAETELRSIVARLSGIKPIVDSAHITVRFTDSSKSLVVQYLHQLLTRSCDSVSVDNYTDRKYNTQNDEPTIRTGRNVVGLISSTIESDQCINVGAHYDSDNQHCLGANGNATGVAIVASLARQVTKLSRRKYNLLIVFFDQEKVGLIWSRYFAEKLKAGRRLVYSVHKIDQVGWDSDGDQAVELELPDTKLYNLYLKVGKNKRFRIPIRYTAVTSIDHQFSRRLGSAIGITEEYVNQDTTPYYHKSTDPYQTVNFKYMESVLLDLQ